MSKKTFKGNKITIEIEDNYKEVMSEFNSKIDMISTAIGEKWRSIVTKEITVRKIVDTGRLRASMNYITDKANREVVVGSPVEYALKNEMDNPKGPYLKPSLLEYQDSYKNIVEAIMEE